MNPKKIICTKRHKILGKKAILEKITFQKTMPVKKAEKK